VADFRDSLDRYGFNYFIYGGWALDIINGDRTRSHTDVDIVLWEKQRDIFKQFLERQRCTIWEEGPKIVFGNEFVNGEAVFMKEDGGDCVLEGKFFKARMPANLLIPFSKARIKNEEFSIGSMELIVKMAQNFSRYPQDKQLANIMARECDKKIMDRIELERKRK